MASNITLHFSLDPTARRSSILELQRDFVLEVTMPRVGEREYTFMRKPADGLSKIYTAFRHFLYSTQIVEGESLRRLIESASQNRDTSGPDIISHPEFKSFARSLRKVEIGLILKRALHKASYLGKGLERIEKEGGSGKVLEEGRWPEALLGDHFFTQDIEIYFREWRISDSYLCFEEWFEHKMTNSTTHLHLSKVAYLSEEEREAFTVSIKEGKVFRRDLPLNTEKMNAANLLGKGILVIGPDKKMYVGSHNIGKFHHSSFLSGSAVFAAGTIATNSDGQIVEISNKSGHYNPGLPQILSMLQLLEDQGIDLSVVKFTKTNDGGPSLGYNSAKAFLDSRGECQPDSFDEFCLIREGGTIVGISHKSSEMARMDVVQGLRSLSAMFSLDLSTPAFHCFTPYNDNVKYLSVGDYMVSNPAIPCGWSGGEIIKDVKGHIVRITQKKGLSKQEDIKSCLALIVFLDQKGLDLTSTILIIEDEEPIAAKEFYTKYARYLTV
ncbi:MAG: hypothetical protein NTX49_04620 [Chlamydiae bacterium]|nr:hypothetical protein [Chlamydiota bacterium]